MNPEEQKTSEAIREQRAAEEQPVTRDSEQNRHEPPRISRGSLVSLVVIVLVVAVAVAIFGIIARKHASAELTKYTDNTSAPPVTLEQPVMQQNAR